MSKILKKKFKTPRAKKTLAWMKDKIPVECPHCKIQLLRKKDLLTERCGNCLQDVTYTVLK